MILDNYGTHKHPKVQTWLAKHPRFHLHFTPTSSSWLNLVERWFRELTDKRIRRGTFGEHSGFGTGHQRIHCREQRCPEALRLDGERGKDFGEDPSL